MSQAGGAKGPTLAGIGAALVVVAPSSLLGVVAATDWEVDLVRFLALVVAAVAWLWPWAMGEGGAVAARMRRWVTAFSAAFAGYVIGGEPIFLIVSLCLGAGCAAGSGMERAQLAAEQVRRRLEGAD